MELLNVVSNLKTIQYILHLYRGTRGPQNRAPRIDILTNISAIIASWNHLIIRPLFHSQHSLLSENLPGGCICVPCFIRLLRVLWHRPNTNFKTHML